MNMFAAVLPLLCFVVLLEKNDLRESFIISAVVTGFFTAISTEILSLFTLVSYTPLVVCWLLYLASLVTWKYCHQSNLQKIMRIETTASQKILLALLFSIVGITGITAIVAAPNNFDSLTYHLPRIMHWVQNHSVEHYPTHIERQLWMAPFSEYAIMHLQILSGGDRFANCVQWFSMLGCAVGVSLIARVLQGSVNSQIVSAALSVSLPMGLLQSTSTQTDYVVSFWLLCLVYFVLKANHSCSSRNAVYVGVVLALAVFTKGTAYLVAVPFMMLYLWHTVARGVKATITNLLVISVTILLINGALYARNIKLYGHPLSSGSGNGIACSRVDPAAIASGVTKNVAIQLSTGVQKSNHALFALAQGIHSTIGVDVNDPDLTEGRGFFMLPAKVLYSEDFAPNPLHMTIMLLAAGSLAFKWKKYSRETILLAAATILSFVVLSAGIKWNLFISRIFLPVFVISAPCIGLLFDENKIRPYVNSCAMLLLGCSFIVLVNNGTRPLTGSQSVFTTNRLDQYFMAGPQAKPYFIATANMIKGQTITNIGILDRDGNMWEYILWVLVKENGTNYRIEHVNVENVSGRIKLDDFYPYFPVRI